MKILHSADLHLDTPFIGKSAQQAQFLREQLRAVPDQLARLCRQELCDLVLLSGDLFDGPWTRESLDSLRYALEDCAVPVFISPGNRDYVNPNSPYRTEHWPSNVHIFQRPRIESCLLEELDCRVYGAGYRSADCGSLLDGFRREHDARYHIGVLHGDPTRADSPCCPVTADQVLRSGLDYLALGHIHKSGQFWQGRTLCAWPGCPMGRGFDETGTKGALLVTVRGDAQVRFVPLDTPRFFEETASTATLPQLLSSVGFRDFYRITLTGEGNQPPLSALYERYSNFPNLELIDHRSAPSALWSQVDTDTLEGVYFRILQDAFKASDPETGQIIELAAQLSWQILNGQEVVLP